MKGIFFIFAFVFCLANFNQTYANNNDSLTITELQKEVDNLNSKLDTISKNLDKSSKKKFHPVRFAFGGITKFYYGTGALGFCAKYSNKNWDYKHYIYADITKSFDDDVYFAVGYLYNIYDYIMLGASFDVIALRPAVMLNLTNDKIFVDFQFSSDFDGNSGIGAAFGICL